MTLFRSGTVERVKCSAVESEQLAIGRWSWGSIEIPSASGYTPSTVQVLVTNGVDISECPDADGVAIAAVSLQNGKAILPLECFYFEAIKLRFDVAPPAEVEILVAVKG